MYQTEIFKKLKEIDKRLESLEKQSESVYISTFRSALSDAKSKLISWVEVEG